MLLLRAVSRRLSDVNQTHLELAFGKLVLKKGSTIILKIPKIKIPELPDDDS